MMKHTLLYIGVAAALLSSTALTSCDGDQAIPPLFIPDGVLAPAGDGTAENPFNASAALSACRKLETGETLTAYTYGIVDSIDIVDPSYGNATYWIGDTGESPADYCLEVYRGKYLDGAKFTSADQIQLGDTVVVYGELVYFNSKYPEYTTGSMLVRHNDKYSSNTPSTGNNTTPAAPAGDGSQSQPFNVAAALQKCKSMADGEQFDAYTKGYIISLEIDPSFGNATYYIGDTPNDATSICLEVYRGYWFNGDRFTSTDQMAVGAEVVVSGILVNFKGNTPEYTTGSRVVSYNGTTSGGGDTPAPAPTGTYTCAPASSIESGSAYVLVVDGQYGAAIGSSLTFGRLNLTDATITDGKFDVDAENVIVITEEAGKGYTLKDSYGRYLGMDDSHFTSFQLYTTLTDGCYWTAAFEDGKLKLTNNLATACFVCVSQGTEGTYYTNMAPASAPTVFKLPELYKATSKQ